MNASKLYIKNMVCNRCKMVVKAEMGKRGFEPISVELGQVELQSAPTDEQKKELTEMLLQLGFELIDDKKSRMIEQVKNEVVKLVHHSKVGLKTNLSDHLAQEIGHDYKYISNLFSEVEGVTIEKYYIAQRIEKVKELLVYDELSLSEIAYRLNYSSVAYLSNQFKKVTGLTPSHFKNIKGNKRLPLDEV